MPVSLPYMVSYKNVPIVFDRIAAAKIPDKFTHSFLQTSIGLKGTNDRPLIPLLRNLGFIDQSGTPSSSYRLLKGDRRSATIADGVRKAYAALFDADDDAYKLSGEKLKSLVAQVAGTDIDMTSRIAGTFSALTKLGDFEASSVDSFSDVEKARNEDKVEEEATASDKVKPRGLRTEFHYNIQVHLPSNATEEVYLNIFNAIRKTFQ